VNEHNDLRIYAIRELPLFLVFKINSEIGENIETKTTMKNQCQRIKVVRVEYQPVGGPGNNGLKI